MATDIAEDYRPRLLTSCLYADGIMVRHLHNVVGWYLSMETAKHSVSQYTGYDIEEAV
jgi:hypothetical protein